VGPKSIRRNRSEHDAAIIFMRFFSRNAIEISYWNRKIKVSAHVMKLDLLFRIPVYVGPNFNHKYTNFLRCHKAISHPAEPFFNSNSNLPEIDITIDCAEKDLDLLGRVIKYAALNVKNPIRQIFVIVPEIDLKRATDVISKLSTTQSIQVKSEDEVISESLRKQIREKFPHRYGWVIHQFITLQQVLSCNIQGILSIDSDTLVLRPMAFLNEESVQVLMESLEYNSSYYEVLNRIHPNFPIKTSSHVTHYSFFQPDIMREIFRILEVSDLLELISIVYDNCDAQSESPFCIDRELYALALRFYFPDRYTLVKFANKSVLRSEIETSDQVSRLSRDFNSVSAHSYLEVSAP
jgi:hypothetical protein